MLEIYPATSFWLPNLPAQAHFPVTVISPLTHRIVLFIEEYHPWGVSVAASSFEYIPPLLFEAAPNVILRTSSQSALKGITVSAPLGLYPQFPSASCPNDRPPKSLFNGVTTHVKKTLKGLIFIPGFTGRKEKNYGKRKNHPW